MSYCRQYNNRWRQQFGVAEMAWVFLQVFLAFGVAVFIVWWTFPKKEKPVEPPAKEAAAPHSVLAMFAGPSG